MTRRISDERFTELSADYEAEQKELKEKAAVLQGELSRTREATANAEKFMKVVRKYTSFEKLSPTLLREFVEKIVIYEKQGAFTRVKAPSFIASVSEKIQAASQVFSVIRRLFL